MIIHFFKSPSDLRSWFEKNHEKSDELWVGYYKRATGKESLTWNESVEEALCFGWIDGIRMSVDEASYTIRFTRRKLKSTWSRKNISTAEKLDQCWENEAFRSGCLSTKKGRQLRNLFL